jgi:hypothetical protein
LASSSGALVSSSKGLEEKYTVSGGGAGVTAVGAGLPDDDVSTVDVRSASGAKKKKKKLVSQDISTKATEAAIKAVTQAMQQNGGDITAAALAIIQQQQQMRQKSRSSGPGSVSSRSLRKDHFEDDEFSISAVSSSTYNTYNTGASSKKKGKAVKKKKKGEDEVSIASGSTTGKAAGKYLDRGGGGGASKLGGLSPIDEDDEGLGASGRKGSPSPSRGARSVISNSQDDADLPPPAMFCFWGSPSKQQQLVKSGASVSSRQSGKGKQKLALVKEQRRGVCAVM